MCHRGTLVIQFLILPHKSAANFLGGLTEDGVPVQITCFTTLGNPVFFEGQAKSGIFAVSLLGQTHMPD